MTHAPILLLVSVPSKSLRIGQAAPASNGWGGFRLPDSGQTHQVCSTEFPGRRPSVSEADSHSLFHYHYAADAHHQADALRHRRVANAPQELSNLRHKESQTSATDKPLRIWYTGVKSHGSAQPEGLRTARRAAGTGQDPQSIESKGDDDA
jgi:hypothetical protein